MITTEHPLVEALTSAEGKAEIVHGRLVQLPMTGEDPHFAAQEITFTLRNYARRRGVGRAAGDSLGFLVDLPQRMSFAPDAAYYVLSPSGMRFVEGAPQFAVEVRSEHDYGPAAEREMAAKRADYFAAGTLVVWDVDLLSEEVVRVFRDGDAETPAATFRRGDLVDAEPAVPGWNMPVDDLFAPGT